MLRNLNQVTFQGFGTVPPERAQGTKYFDKNTAQRWDLRQQEVPVWNQRKCDLQSESLYG